MLLLLQSLAAALCSSTLQDKEQNGGKVPFHAADKGHRSSTGAGATA
jgi:hypothetical protein